MTNLKTTLSNKKGRNFLIFAFIMSILAISYPIFIKFYYKPHKWINQLTNLSRVNFKNSNISEENLQNFSQCIYTKFHISYGNVDKFPTADKYSQQDYNDIFDCQIEYIIADSLKDFCRKNKSLILEHDRKKRENKNM